MFIEFTIPGIPVAKGRARAAVRGGVAQIYTPEPTRIFENLVKMAASETMQNNPPLQGALRLNVWIVLPIPKSMTKADRKGIALGETLPTKKPDISNVIKSVEDGMNAIVYMDDSQIVTSCTHKRFGEVPHVKVQVRPYSKLLDG